jgi:hypothetical protein
MIRFGNTFSILLLFYDPRILGSENLGTNVIPFVSLKLDKNGK